MNLSNNTTCSNCSGKGIVADFVEVVGAKLIFSPKTQCTVCHGTGHIEASKPELLIATSAPDGVVFAIDNTKWKTDSVTPDRAKETPQADKDAYYKRWGELRKILDEFQQRVRDCKYSDPDFDQEDCTCEKHDTLEAIQALYIDHINGAKQ